MELIKGTSDIFLLSESKLDSSFPDNQFSIAGYRVVKRDPNRDGRELLWCINKNVSFKLIQSSSLLITLEVLPIEINLGNFKFLLIGLMNSHWAEKKNFYAI